MHAAISVAEELGSRVAAVEADLTLLGARVEDGSLERARGSLIQDLRSRLANAVAAAASAAAGERSARFDLESLQVALHAAEQAHVRHSAPVQPLSLTTPSVESGTS